ncbi:MAG: hypothetical protein RIC95_07215 [Vicingaceae bacterium]
MTLPPDYYLLAHQFLNISRNSIDEMKKQGNKNSMTFNYQGSKEASDKYYEEMTKWNDMNVSVPILFNYHHGIELMTKAMLKELKVKFETNHDLDKLIGQLETSKQLPSSLTESLRFHISKKSPFHDYFKTNNATPDQLNELLRYPERKKQIYNLEKVLVQEGEGLNKFIAIRDNIDLVKSELFSWKRNKKGS